jgi:hypothetical protein
LFIRFWITRWAHTWARKTETKLDDVIISAVDKPILIWAVLGGFYAAHPYLGITLPTQLASILDRLVLAALILSISWSLANLAGGVFRYYGHRIGAAVQIISLSQLMAKLLVLVIRHYCSISRIWRRGYTDSYFTWDWRACDSAGVTGHVGQHVFRVLHSS